MSAIMWDHEPVLSRPLSRPAVRPLRARATGRGSLRAVGGVARPTSTGAAGRTAATHAAHGESDAGEHLRLTRRGRTVVWAAAVLVAAGVGLSAQSAGADGPGAATPVETHVVAPGETLWQIASSVAAPGEDVRVVVDELVELNGLGGAGLQAGQQILVPVD